MTRAECIKRYRDKNRKQLNEYQRKYNAEHPEWRSEINRLQYQRRKQLGFYDK